MTIAQFVIEPEPGRKLEGVASAFRSDLREMKLLSVKYLPLPEAGTPVAVVYLDDQAYQML